MDNTNDRDSKGQTPHSRVSDDSDYRSSSEVLKSNSTPTIVLLWVWNWFANLPKTMTNIYTDFKNGELLSRFQFLDAMLQFIVAVATSCHPQEELETDEYKKSETSSNSGKQEFKAFDGAGRSLRSRTISAN